MKESHLYPSLPPSKWSRWNQPPAKTPGGATFPTGNLSGKKNQQTPRVAGDENQENQPRKHRQNFDIFSADRSHIAVHFFRIRLAFFFWGWAGRLRSHFVLGCSEMFVYLYISVYVHPGMQKEHRIGPGW